MTATCAPVASTPSLEADAPTTTARKPLYLFARQAIEVRAEDVSLAVYRGRVPLGRYPMQRLSRIVATARVHWRGEALAMCFSHGIPVLMVDLRGTLLGTCVPSRVRVSPLTELLDELTADSRWKPVYENFLRHLRSRVFRTWEAECAAAGHPLSESERAQWVRSFVHMGQPPQEAAFDCRGLLRGLVERQLHLASVRSHYWAEGGEHLDLARDLSDILYGRLLMHAGSLFTAQAEPAAVFRLFEGSVGEHDGDVTRLLASLQRYLLRRMHRWQ